jgi:hypothetical protein
MTPDAQCFICKHFNPDKLVEPTNDESQFTCHAFPDGIPDTWLLRKHNRVVVGQVDSYVFEEKVQ